MEWFHNQRNLLIAEGILFSILGLLAVAMPVISTLSTELFLGWLFVFGGATQLYRSFKTRHAPGFTGSFLMGLFYLIFGILLILFPIAGMFSLTILLTILFIAVGLSKIIFGVQIRPFGSTAWLFLLNGALSLIMAAIIWSGWPGTAFWVLGLLVGINMIFFGMSLLFFGMELPKNSIK